MLSPIQLLKETSGNYAEEICFVFPYDLYVFSRDSRKEFLKINVKISKFTNLHESLEKNLEVVWKNEGHTSSA